MAEIINFFGQSQTYKEGRRGIDVISFLPKLKYLNGETMVISIDEKIITDGKLLENFLREILLMKYVGVSVILVMDIRSEVNKYLYENSGIESKLDNDVAVSIEKDYDVVDVLIKHNGLNAVYDVMDNFGANVLAVSASTLGIKFADIGANDFAFFEKDRRNFNNVGFKNKTSKTSVGLLDEILKTDIIPIISPIVRDFHGVNYVMEGKYFSARLAGLLGALKCVITYSDEKKIPKGCVYGADRIVEVVGEDGYSANFSNVAKASAEAIKNGTQGVHIIDPKTVDIVEELCSGNFSGIFVYEDEVSHL